VMHADALAMLARERRSSLLAQAQAARWAKQARSTAETARLRCSVAARAARIHAPGRGSAGTRLVRAVLAADRGAVEAELADQAAFNSPIRRYTNRADVVHLLSLIGPILPARASNEPGKAGAARRR
jgi:hypothetical protein